MAHKTPMIMNSKISDFVVPNRASEKGFMTFLDSQLSTYDSIPQVCPVSTFGCAIPSRQEVLARPQCAEYISSTLNRFLAALDVSDEILPGLVKQILEMAKQEIDDSWYEEATHNLLRNNASSSAQDMALEDRSYRILKQLSPYIVKGETLDYGCGDARVAKLINNFQGCVTLADVYQHPSINRTEMEFVMLASEGSVPLPSARFDNVLLCTVLHHAERPLETLNEAIRVAKPNGRILIIESVYGVDLNVGTETPQSPVATAFLGLSEEDQLAVNSFFDHLYNRCLYYSSEPTTKVNVPYNYKSPRDWQETIESMGLRIEAFVPLGIDQPLGPLFHVLYVAVKP